MIVDVRGHVGLRVGHHPYEDSGNCAGAIDAEILEAFTAQRRRLLLDLGGMRPGGELRFLQRDLLGYAIQRLLANRR